MIPGFGQDCILSKDLSLPREGGVIPAGSIGRLVEIIDEKRVTLFFEGRGRVEVHVMSIRPIMFSAGESVYIVDRDGTRTEGVIEDIWISSTPSYIYRIHSKGAYKSYEHSFLRKIETLGEPMVISELAKALISRGQSLSPQDVPEWFRTVILSIRTMPDIGKMSQDQVEFLIKNHMSNRVIDNTTDLVANVMFVLQANPTYEHRKMEERLYGYKAKLDAEWKKLGKVVPIEYQYAALKAYAEYK